MKKVLSYILISVILLANLLAPFSVGWGTKNQIQVQKNEALAVGERTDISLNSSTDHSIGVEGDYFSSEKMDKITAYFYIGTSSDKLVQILNFNSGTVTTNTTGEVPIYTYHFGYTLTYYSTDGKVNGTTAELVKGNTYYVAVRIAKILPDGKTREFIPGTDSKIVSAVVGVKSQTGFATSETGIAQAQIDHDAAFNPAYNAAIKEGKTPEEAKIIAEKAAQQVVLSKNYDSKADVSSKPLPSCGLFGDSTLMGCLVQTFYYVLFVPTSYLFALAGTMFDYTFSYSIQDTSYRSAFVVQGWGLVRDFCNMFFIFIMLYVAIGTVLSLHSMKTKETIINIVIIGLFINFSLFATQVIIDASNITARVFYNSDAIQITQKDANGVTKATPGLKIGEDGIIPLSAALVNKVNPQNIIMSSDKLNSIKNINSSSVTEDNNSKSLSIGQFILLILMTSAVNIVGFIVFLTVAFLFIARVIGLWFAMILAPLAFFTYILPSMAKTKMIGWEHWWGDTLKLAFLAPVFIFFMYIILKFLQADLISDIAKKSLSGDGLGYFVAILVPFAFIMILMIRAKKIAVDMSGEFGEMAVKAGSAVGGLALGGAIGASAFAMRGTIGALGSKLGESEWAKKNGRFGRMLGDAGKWTASKSFDARKTALGAAAGKSMGVDMGKAKEGGYTKHKEEITAKRRERFESLKLGDNSKEVQELWKAEERKSNLSNDLTNDTNRVVGMLGAKRTIAIDLTQKLNAADKEVEILEKEYKAKNATDKEADWTPEEQAAIAAKRDVAEKARALFKKNQDTIDRNEKERQDINGAKGKYAHKTGNGKVNEVEYNKFIEDIYNKATATRDLAKKIANGDAIAEKEAEDEYNSVQKAYEEMQEAIADKNRGFEKDPTKVESFDNLNLRIVPHLHHEVEHKNADTVNKYATEIRGRMFNERANDKAAHDAIIKAEVKKH